MSSLSDIDFTPEVKFYTYKAGLPDAINSTVDFSSIILQNMDEDHLYNQEMWGDILIPGTDKNKHANFQNKSFRNYLRYVSF